MWIWIKWEKINYARNLAGLELRVSHFDTMLKNVEWSLFSKALSYSRMVFLILIFNNKTTFVCPFFLIFLLLLLLSLSWKWKWLWWCLVSIPTCSSLLVFVGKVLSSMVLQLRVRAFFWSQNWYMHFFFNLMIGFNEDMVISYHSIILMVWW